MLVPKKVDEGGQQFGEQVLAAYQASPTRVKDHLGQLPEPEISMAHFCPLWPSIQGPLS